MSVSDLSRFPELEVKLNNIKVAVKKIWERPKIVHFTRHGIEHSEMIIRILDLILGDMSTMKEKLNEHEKFILLASAYLHDIGMQSAYHAGLPEKNDYDLNDKMKIRENHHEASYKMIMESVNPKAERRVNCGLENCTQPNYVEYIALLAKKSQKRQAAN